MIQRIQSILFFLAALFLGLLYFEPFSLATSETQPDSPYFNDGAFEAQDNALMIALYAVAILLSIVTIFLYNNRTYQRVAAWLSIFATLLAVSYSAFLFTTDGNDFDQVRLGWGFWIPFITIFLLAMGSRRVKKDDELVKSADRLR